MKKAMLIIPHQDDELLVGGSALISLVRSADWKVKVVYLTNGDSRPWEAQIRLKDSQKVLTTMGMKKSDIIYMGYGNRWSEKEHLYNCAENCMIASRAQRTETYGTNEIEDFHYTKYQQHAQYTRNNCKNDLKEIISEWLPSVILSADLDKHEDHIALSLLFEECMGEILKENKGYTPLLLKKFAYSGVWNGSKDYWELPHKETLMDKGLNNYFYKWEERLQFAVPEDCNTVSIRKNTLYRLAKIYRTQYVWTRVSSFANDDICFWRRFSENLALHADFSASSGDVSCLNDFMLLNSSDIRDNHVCQFDTGYWTPEERDKEKVVTISFTEPQEINDMVIYENSQPDSGINKIAIQLNDDVHVQAVDIQERMKNVISIHAQEVMSIKIQIMECYGNSFGFSEIELYNKLIPIETYDLPMTKYHKKEHGENTLLSGKMKLDKKIFMLQERISREWWLPKYELRAQYAILENHGYLYIFVQGYRLMKKCLSKLCAMLSITKEKQK